MNKRLLNELLDILDKNDKAIQLIINFIEQHPNINKEKVFEYIIKDLNNIDKFSDINKDLQFSVIDNIICKICPNSDLSSSSGANSTFFLSLLAIKAQSLELKKLKSQSEELIIKLATDIQCFKEPDLRVLWKDYRFSDGSIVPLQASHNAAIFKIPAQNGIYLELDECWCQEGLSRDNPYNIRTLMEEEIVKIINTHLDDQTKVIRIVNIGSDMIGLLVILAKVYLLGYQNIDIMNIELSDMQNHEEYPSKNQEYLKFLTETFGEFCSYHMIFSDKQNIRDEIANCREADITIVFAEDLGGVDKLEYNNTYKFIVDNIATQLYLFYPGNIFISEHTGNMLKYINTSINIKQKHLLR